VDGHVSKVEVPETRYAQSGDLSIAYQVTGDGPFDVVFVSGFVSHQELQWELFPEFPIVGVSKYARLITFDKRGTGLSERTLGFGSAEERMDDIRAVMDAAGSERAALIGVSEGGPLATLFAATYPQRASALVLLATYARGQHAPDYPMGFDPADAAALLEHASTSWGTGQVLPIFLNGLPDDERGRNLVGRYERNTATPKMVREILQRNIEMDVRGALPAIRVPTLVLHRRNDPIVPFATGQYLAEHIDGARFVELEGNMHVSAAPGGEDETFAIIEEFLTGQRAQREVPIDRVLATVLFVDIVGSTARAAELGDRRWRELLDKFRAVVRKELERHRGREVNTRGDDFLAMFDGPGRAIACAHAIASAARPLEIEVRAGLHTGEVELQGDDIAGIAVHIGARVAGLANANEVLVTSTVRDLVIGSGIEFATRGAHELKGVPGEWNVLEVVA
jgi:pimeloyl-ACP methyl ester carboxylesterase